MKESLSNSLNLEAAVCDPRLADGLTAIPHDSQRVLRFENEVALTIEELGADKIDAVIPSASIRVDNPVAWIDRPVKKCGTEKLSKADPEDPFGDESAMRSLSRLTLNVDRASVVVQKPADRLETSAFELLSLNPEKFPSVKAGTKTALFPSASGSNRRKAVRKFSKKRRVTDTLQAFISVRENYSAPVPAVLSLDSKPEQARCAAIKRAAEFLVALGADDQREGCVVNDAANVHDVFVGLSGPREPTGTGTDLR